MKIRNILLIGTLLFSVFLQAQDIEKTKKQINTVKKSNLYIYAEATAETEEDARAIAEDILYQEINQWAAKKKKMQNSPYLVVNNKKEYQTYYSLPRGNMYRSFIFVKKSDIISSEGGAEAIPVSSNLSKREASSYSTVEPVYPKAVNVIAAYTEYKDMAEKIKELKATGEIKHYARYASLEKPEIYYLAIYNTSGKVVAVLTPGKDRTNVRTGQPDKVTNYSGCGAIGFTINE